ncbi:MAG: MFS transporter [Phycisphaerae bacterium]|nr:MFS transporter [Phycisphaerae bacterium]
MSASPNQISAASPNAPRLFNASCLALIVTAMSFAIRGAAMGSWTEEFGLSNEQVGWINGTAFWGFTLAMVFGGPLCDAIGMRRIVGLATVGHLAGILLTIFAWDYWSLFGGTLLFGIANGSVEAACNPLIAALYPNNKTTKLNQFHVWFPGGIVIGGLVGYLMGKIGLGWQAQFATMLLPLAAYAILFVGQSMPKTERVEMGVSTGDMFAACLHPIFILMVFCMLLTAATELGPNQWIPNILENAGVSGLLVLVWITGLMAVGRQFAGPFVHRLQPLGMLLGSAILSAAGLFLMSQTEGPMLFASATVFAFGVCFFWPTMLGYTNERFPKTGALGLAIMGGAGMLSASYVLPLIGRWYDDGIAARIPEGVNVEALQAAGAGSEEAGQWASIQAEAGLEAFGQVAYLPIGLAVIFLVLFLFTPRKASHTD